MEINSYNIRAILMYYFRYKRQFIACSEVTTDCRESADVLVATKKYMMEIEIKTSKQDLIKGEERKNKHKRENEKRIVNKFFICVPTELIPDAEEWVRTVNPKYGIIEFFSKLATEGKFYKYELLLRVIKNADVLQPKFSEYLKDKMFKRLSSALTTEYIGRMK